jgi:hypothetical protein
MLHQQGTITALIASPSPSARAPIRLFQGFDEDIDYDISGSNKVSMGAA